MDIVRRGHFFLTGPIKCGLEQELSSHAGHDGALLEVSNTISILKILTVSKKLLSKIQFFRRGQILTECIHAIFEHVKHKDRARLN